MCLKVLVPRCQGQERLSAKISPLFALQLKNPCPDVPRLLSRNVGCVGPNAVVSFSPTPRHPALWNCVHCASIHH